MTTSVTHLWRLLKWGRTLARHGALRGIEEDPLTPPPVRRLARIARFGAPSPPTPDYAAALVAIGPAAIKLGQALSTRPDLVGERAALPCHGFELWLLRFHRKAPTFTRNAVTAESVPPTGEIE